MFSVSPYIYLLFAHLWSKQAHLIFKPFKIVFILFEKKIKADSKDDCKTILIEYRPWTSFQIWVNWVSVCNFGCIWWWGLCFTFLGVKYGQQILVQAVCNHETAYFWEYFDLVLYNVTSRCHFIKRTFLQIRCEYL